jgi:hypothetical protein
MKPQITWSVLEESFDILGGYGFPAMDRTATELALEPGWFTWVAAIWLFGSEPITTANFMRMLPYGLARLNEERFASAAGQGCLISDGEGGYSPAERGLDAAHKIWRAAGDSLADLSSLPEENLHRLFSYLVRIADTALAAPEPPSHFFLAHKRENYRRFGTQYPLEGFVVRFGELSAHRDDAHIAAWQAHEIEGHAWEILTYLWCNTSAASADTLFEKVGYRSIPLEVYTQDLQELAGRGWIEETAGEYLPSAEGKRIREEAETLTDRYFFAPWSCLSEAELEDLFNLSTELRDGLKKSEGK